jgi:hypothetical protein
VIDIIDLARQGDVFMSTENQSTEPTPQLPIHTRIELSEGKASISLAPVGSHDTDPFAAQDIQRSPLPNTQPTAQSESNAASEQTISAEAQPAQG